MPGCHLKLCGDVGLATRWKMATLFHSRRHISFEFGLNNFPAALSFESVQNRAIVNGHEQSLLFSRVAKVKQISAQSNPYPANYGNLVSTSSSPFPPSHMNYKQTALNNK
jgi:hypothetical protein